MLRTLRRFYCSTSTTNYLPTVDRFGNHLYNITNTTNCLESLVKNTPIGKAVLLTGSKLDVSTMTKIKAKLQYINNDSETWLVKNGSVCPELFNGQYYAAGINIIIRWDGDFWTVMVKDKTKPYITCPGGTASSIDFTNLPTIDELHRNIATRELTEETNNLYNDLPGLDIQKLKIEPYFMKVCKFNFRSKFFNLDNIVDNYQMYGIYIDMDANTKLLEKISPKLLTRDTIDFLAYINRLCRGKIVDSDYKINSSKNNEIEYVYLQKLTDASSITDDLVIGASTYKLNKHPVSALHLFAAYHNLYRHTNIKYTKPIDWTSSELLPSNLTSVKLY